MSATLRRGRALVLAAALLGALCLVACSGDRREPSGQGERRVAGEHRPAPAAVAAPKGAADQNGGTYPYLIYTIPPAPRVNDPVRDPARPAVKIKGDDPAYTEAARRARIQGIVIVEVLIERDGRVSAARVLKPLPFGLAEAAQRAVMTWRYKPAREGERIVRTVRNELLHFKLPPNGRR